MPRRFLPVLVLAALALLTAIAFVRTGGAPPAYRVLDARPSAIMGTECRLDAVLPLRDPDDGPGEAALAAAEAALRSVEARMSSWIDASEISRLNRAKEGELTPLSAESRFVLAEARRLHAATGGAFDATCRPLIELWRAAGESGTLPSADALAEARAASSWELIAVDGEGVRKGATSARVDLGGIAKGYGIDAALEALRAAGVPGGLVEVGGDLRVFGVSPDGGAWKVALRSPWDDEPLASVALDDGAVCTSGHYARFFEIEGRRLSHIVDPRSGWPAEETHSVTVVAKSALEADAWATALSVLGPEGLAAIPEGSGVYALVVHGDRDAPRAAASPGFPLVEARATFLEQRTPGKGVEADRP